MNLEEFLNIPETIHIGFTGTAEGMTIEQKAMLRKYLCKRYRRSVLHHGDCIGADEQAHDIAREYDCKCWRHPPEIDKARAFKQCEWSEEPLPFLKRNRAIVDAVKILIACPRTEGETLRSGTWATVRYAREAGVPIVIILPDGIIRQED